MESKQNAWIESLYIGAKDADEVFHAAVIKQFGKRKSADMRYRYTLHNAETRLAAGNYWAACKRLHDAIDSARNSAPSVYCVECGAESELDCLCDDLNHSQYEVLHPSNTI